jgi:hypothetical protein
VTFAFRRLAVALGLGCALALTPVAARADAESDAKDLFARAHDMRTHGDCAGAVPLFRKAYERYPKGLGSLRNIAECEEQLGHWASSRRAWLDLKRALITLPAPDPKYDGWEKDADDGAARLKPKVATVFVDVTVKTPQGEGPANEQSGIELLVNGESLGTALVGTPLDRDPGTYRIRVQAPDAQPVETSVSLSAGDSKHVALHLTRTPKEVAQPGGGIVEPPNVEQGGSGRRTVGWIVLGVGGAALVGGVVTLILRGSAKSDLESTCGSTDTCPRSKQSEADDITSRGKTMSTLTTILGIAGGVGVVGGAALILTSPSSKTGSIVVRPTVGGANATWSF